MKRFVVWGIVPFLAFVASCGKIGVFEKTENFQHFQWDSLQRPRIRFQIEDTVSLYDIYVVVRHQDAYHFNNLWLYVTTQAPGSPADRQQLELTLAKDNKGWLGTGIDDIFTHWIKITRKPVRLKKGEYVFTLQHIMRENPLAAVLSAGIKLERAAQ